MKLHVSVCLVMATLALSSSAAADDAPTQAESSDYVDGSNKALADATANAAVNVELFYQECSIKAGAFTSTLKRDSFMDAVGAEFVKNNVGMSSRLDSFLFSARQACTGKATSELMQKVKVLQFVASKDEFLRFDKATGTLCFGVRANRSFSGSSKDVLAAVEKGLSGKK